MATRELYKWSEEVEASNYADCKRNMEWLRWFAGKVWAVECPHRKRPDVVWARWQKTSYYDPDDHFIIIAAHQMCLSVLLHELVHAAGLHRHDARFANVWCDWLCRYAHCHRAHIRRSMRRYGVAL